jgi:hypothetical protein
VELRQVLVGSKWNSNFNYCSEIARKVNSIAEKSRRKPTKEKAKRHWRRDLSMTIRSWEMKSDSRKKCDQGRRSLWNLKSFDWMPRDHWSERLFGIKRSFVVCMSTCARGRFRWSRSIWMSRCCNIPLEARHSHTHPPPSIVDWRQVKVSLTPRIQNAPQSICSPQITESSETESEIAAEMHRNRFKARASQRQRNRELVKWRNKIVYDRSCCQVRNFI